MGRSPRPARKPGRLSPTVAVLLTVVTSVVVGCQWQGLNSLPMPGTQGGGSDSYTVTAELPDVGTLEPNSRVRVGDVNVGTVTSIERRDWHALLELRLNRDVQLPANATAKVGQTSLLGSLHVELAVPADEPPRGRLHDGSVIPLDDGGAYPSTDQTLASVSLLLNGGGLGQVQDITKAFATAFHDRESDLRSLIEQLDIFTAQLDHQTGDIVTATDSFNRLVGQFAAQEPVLDSAVRTIPEAVSILAEERHKLIDAVDAFGRFSAVANDALSQTKSSLVQELRDIAPVLKSLADAGPAMTRSMDILATYPWPKATVDKWIRGDYGNLMAVVDLTLSRLDNSLLTGTRWEGSLTELEMQWGRTIGQIPSPYTSGNPLVVPYRIDQGP